MQFTYSFSSPHLGSDVITDAMVADKEYVPGHWNELPRQCMVGLVEVEERMCFISAPSERVEGVPVSEASLNRVL